MEKLKEPDIHEKYGKNIRIAFRISQNAKDQLERVADLFQLEPSQVAKAIIYMHLGVFEPIDQRRRSWRKSKKKRKGTYLRE